MSNIIIDHLFLYMYSTTNIITSIKKGSENTIFKIIPIMAIIKAAAIISPTIGSITIPTIDNTKHKVNITNKMQNKVIINNSPHLIFCHLFSHLCYFVLHPL